MGTYVNGPALCAVVYKHFNGVRVPELVRIDEGWDLVDGEPVPVLKDGWRLVGESHEREYRSQF